jgi:hypothetical protein
MPEIKAPRLGQNSNTKGSASLASYLPGVWTYQSVGSNLLCSSVELWRLECGSVAVVVLVEASFADCGIALDRDCRWRANSE